MSPSAIFRFSLVPHLLCERMAFQCAEVDGSTTRQLIQGTESPNKSFMESFIFWIWSWRSQFSSLCNNRYIYSGSTLNNQFNYGSGRALRDYDDTQLILILCSPVFPSLQCAPHPVKPRKCMREIFVLGKTFLVNCTKGGTPLWTISNHYWLTN